MNKLQILIKQLKKIFYFHFGDCLNLKFIDEIHRVNYELSVHYYFLFSVFN